MYGIASLICCECRLTCLVSQIQTIPSAPYGRSQPNDRDFKSRAPSKGGRSGFRGNFREGFKGNRKSSSGSSKNKSTGGVAKKKPAGKRNSSSTFAGASARNGGSSGGFGGGGIGIMPT